MITQILSSQTSKRVQGLGWSLSSSRSYNACTVKLFDFLKLHSGRRWCALILHGIKKTWSTRFRPPEEIYWSSSFNRRYQNMDTKQSIILIYLLFQSAPRELWISHNCLLWTSQYKMNLKRLLTARKSTWFLDRKLGESDLISEDLSTLRRHFQLFQSMV